MRVNETLRTYVDGFPFGEGGGDNFRSLNYPEAIAAAGRQGQRRPTFSRKSETVFILGRDSGLSSVQAIAS